MPRTTNAVLYRAQPSSVYRYGSLQWTMDLLALQGFAQGKMGSGQGCAFLPHHVLSFWWRGVDASQVPGPVDRCFVRKNYNSSYIELALCILHDNDHLNCLLAENSQSPPRAAIRIWSRLLIADYSMELLSSQGWYPTNTVPVDCCMPVDGTNCCVTRSKSELQAKVLVRASPLVKFPLSVAN